MVLAFGLKLQFFLDYSVCQTPLLDIGFVKPPQSHDLIPQNKSLYTQTHTHTHTQTHVYTHTHTHPLGSVFLKTLKTLWLAE